jgi:molybdenum cofactor cytidylyltransferase
VIARAAEAGLSPVVAVVPPRLPLPAAPGVELVRVANAEPKLGMSHSLRLGLAAVPAAADAALILLGDQPTLPLATIAAVVAARGKRPLVAASAGGRLAPPVLIERSHFHLADAAAGDVGLREILAERGEQVATVEVTAHVPDVDTPADLAALAEDATATRE